MGTTARPEGDRGLERGPRGAQRHFGALSSAIPLDLHHPVAHRSEPGSPSPHQEIREALARPPGGRRDRGNHGLSSPRGQCAGASTDLDGRGNRHFAAGVGGKDALGASRHSSRTGERADLEGRVDRGSGQAAPMGRGGEGCPENSRSGGLEASGLARAGLARASPTAVSADPRGDAGEATEGRE